MTDQELRDLVAENSRQIASLTADVRQTTRQVGELGNKFGKFTEGLFFPSLVRILSERFGITNTTSRVRVTDAASGEVVMKLDGFGYANSAKNVAVVIEVKTELREENIRELLVKLRSVRTAMPEHAGKKLYGVIAAAILPENLRRRALKAGLFVASIADDTFRLTNEPPAPIDFSADDEIK